MPGFRDRMAALRCPAAALIVAAGSTGCGGDGALDPAADAGGAQSRRPAYVGSAACADCHRSETEAWRGSHHDLAMQRPTADAVLGDFDGGRHVDGSGRTIRFERRDGQPWVLIEHAGLAGRTEYPVSHVFGAVPLQQLLIRLPGGAEQAFTVAWDDRPADAGGQRWFDLAPADGDSPHWTDPLYTWNSMCADCHSTAVRKQFDIETGRYATTHAEIDIGCEACHGPASAHVADPAGAPLALGRVERAWVRGADMPIAARVPPTPDRTELETCARCHSRRTQVSEDWRPGEPLLDGYLPSRLDRGLYHSDGQILDEVFVYGSFLQSAMHAAGVTCSDCHEPHTLAPRAAGNDLCGQCHLPAEFDTTAHHRHTQGAAGSQCVDCHMAGRHYMRIDLRRDHSFRVPRPDVSIETGSPNACTDCHSDRDASWAAAAIERWFPDGRHGQAHFASALDAGRRWAGDRSARLIALALDRDSSAIVRASALALMREQLDERMVEPVLGALRDPEPLVALGALAALEALPPGRRGAAQALLTHELRAVRAEAGRVLNSARGTLSAPRRADLDTALAEYMSMQRLHSDRAFGRVNLAIVALEQGDTVRAERLLREAMRVEPSAPTAYLYLAELLRGDRRVAEADALIQRAARVAPGDAAVWSALGLARVRADDAEGALAALRRAQELAPDEPGHAYLLGVALDSYGPDTEARAVLSQAARDFPGHRDVVFAAATVHRDAGDVGTALELAVPLAERFPADAEIRALVETLRRAVPQ